MRWCDSFWLVGMLHPANPRKYMRIERPPEACLCAVVYFILVDWCVAFCKSGRVHENRETFGGVSVCGGVFHSGWLVCCILQSERVHENRETSRGVSVCGGVFHSG